MTTQAFDRNTLKTLRNEINDALNTVANKHGIYLSIGNIRFSSNNFRCKLEGNIRNPNASGTPAATSSEMKWRKGLDSVAAYSVGLTLADAGKLFNLYGEEYLLVGFRPNAKAKVVARKPGRKTYSALPHQPVVAALKTA